jgi:glycosyltransferase involved in cell wall biosynthesis
MSSVQQVFSEVCQPLRATVVIVLYRIAPADSPAVRSVMKALEGVSTQDAEVRIILWDNSPQEQRDPVVPALVSYINDPNNSGLANAYNRALEAAILHQSEWLITLDQDTAVPRNYFSKMASAARLCSKFAGIGAIVPQIEAEGRSLSPNRFQLGAIPCWYRRGFRGAPRETVFAFNSGSMLSVAALMQVGGYDPWFWLDDSDAQVFSRLHQHGKRVYIAGDIQLQHEFSMKNMSARMSGWRYRNALMAETAFWDTRMNRLAGWERTLRLMLRLIKHRFRKDSSELQRITWNALERRLLTPKEKRIEEWKEATRQQLGDRLESTGLPARQPKISACMAAYNGAPFIDAQLKSILSQLNEWDELVIVDDCSQDDTVDRIMQFKDTRIRLLRHTANAGVVATFEDALRSATGDILFLCDDDDMWAPTKVSRFLDVFDTRPDVEVVTSRVILIDESDARLPDSRLNRRGKFLPGFWQNLVKNHYQGSAMAIRASLLGQVLPFPHRKSFLHDAWIGTRNDILGGKAAFIDEDLLFYRRHTKNVSNTKSRLHQLKTRVDLLLAHIMYALRLTTP